MTGAEIEQDIKDSKDLKNKETELEDINLTLAELRDVARGKALMMIQEVQDLSKTDRVLIKREIPDKFIQCFQGLAEVLILEERIFSELCKLTDSDDSVGLFNQFKEFSKALMPEQGDSACAESDAKGDIALKTETEVLVEGMPVKMTGQVETQNG